MTDKKFISKNSVSLCGRIMKITKYKKDEVRIVLGVAKNDKTKAYEKDGKIIRPIKRDKDGKILRDYITIKFFDDIAKNVLNNYVAGDFVVVNAVVQNVRNHYDETNAVNVWGVQVAPKRQRGRIINDHNQVNLRGKIVSATVVKDNFIIVNLLTKIDKPRGKNKSVIYKSVTPIGFYLPDNSAKQRIAEFTKGTWINVRGYLKAYDKDIRPNVTGDKQIRRTIYVYGVEYNVIGIIQPAEDELYKDYQKEKLQQ